MTNRRWLTPVLAATIAAACLIAQQVIGKATRDALLLSHFPVARLPVVMIAGSVASSAVVWLTTRLVARFGPARVVPFAFLLNGAATLLEWALASRFEAVIALAFFIQTIAVGGPLVSAFWSVVSEGFDPHTAKAAGGRIGVGAALGGLLGGAGAWSASRICGVPTLLGVIAVLNGACAWGLMRLARGTQVGRVQAGKPGKRTSAVTALRRTPYLRLLAGLVFLGALTQSLLDYALGVEATAAYGSGPRLLAFFAVFQTAIGLLSFLFQLAANRHALERLGVGGTLAVLPGSVVAIGAIALGAPSLASVVLQRGAEGVFRASLFRSAYEVLYTPVPRALKRATKMMVDVTFDRGGLVVGSALTLGALAIFPHDALRAVIATAIVGAGFELVLAYRLHHGYITTLAQELRAGTVVLDAVNVVDRTTRQTLARTRASIDRQTVLARVETLRASGTSGKVEAVRETAAPDEVVRALADLRTGDAATIRRALAPGDCRHLPLAYPILMLLARDDVAHEASLALAPLVPRIVGAIVDTALDANVPPAARRRAVRLLGPLPSQRAAVALEPVLDVEAADVRYTCGQILVAMREMNPVLRFDSASMIARAHRELDATRDDGTRRTRQFEHAFNVLSLTLPREPMQLAYGALVAGDAFVRGVALEYLDAVLPAHLRSLIVRPHAAKSRTDGLRSRERALDELLESKELIRLRLEDLRRARYDRDEPTG